MSDQSESTKRTAELVRLMRDPRAVMTMIAERDQLFGETEQLKAENEALRQNARRYQWIRHGDLDQLAADNWGDGEVWEGERLDVAIDAAIRKGEQE